MNNNQISKDFLEASFSLGEEILGKSNPTETERYFLHHLDKLLEIIEKNQR